MDVFSTTEHGRAQPACHRQQILCLSLPYPSSEAPSPLPPAPVTMPCRVTQGLLASDGHCIWHRLLKRHVTHHHALRHRVGMRPAHRPVLSTARNHRQHERHRAVRSCHRHLHCAGPYNACARREFDIMSVQLSWLPPRNTCSITLGSFSFTAIQFHQVSYNVMPYQNAIP